MIIAGRGLGKSEILRHKRAISNIFSSTEALKFTCFPIKFILIPVNDRDEVKVKCLFTVPVRNIKLAVQRNLIRRRIKEAYRLQKSELYNVLSPQSNYHLGIMFISKELVAFDKIEQAFKKLRNELVKKDLESFS